MGSDEVSLKVFLLIDLFSPNLSNSEVITQNHLLNQCLHNGTDVGLRRPVCSKLYNLAAALDVAYSVTELLPDSYTKYDMKYHLILHIDICMYHLH